MASFVVKYIQVNVAIGPVPNLEDHMACIRKSNCPNVEIYIISLYTTLNYAHEGTVDAHSHHNQGNGQSGGLD